MVRAGRVAHPNEWPWCGYQELAGQRKRYRLIDVAGLCEALELPSVEAFRAEYRERLNERLSRPHPAREAQWTEALAVGKEAFVQQVAMTMRNRLKLEIVPESSGGSAFVLRERASGYGNA